ncbi:hypothetical protein EVAR_9050_1 [Eumeta japonica]|uniref:Uncharacterized protein n=1 Tax=Eumeta variegata TaxID=151549 RepID=A0A4C1TWA8_EUMVA|nr:hypothetical protein EVAR_9050_1 [Eumeta japonica]
MLPKALGGIPTPPARAGAADASTYLCGSCSRGELIQRLSEEAAGGGSASDLKRLPVNKLACPGVRSPFFSALGRYMRYLPLPPPSRIINLRGDIKNI